jgi:hypothetical protein
MLRLHLLAAATTVVLPTGPVHACSQSGVSDLQAVVDAPTAHMSLCDELKECVDACCVALNPGATRVAVLSV